MSSMKKLCTCAVCIALCCVLPTAFHAFGLGIAFSPLHLPVLLCGVICGWPYGAVCGVAGPLLSSLLTSMPAPSQLLHMIPELLVYGLASGLLMGLLHTGNVYGDLYGSLVPAMVLGRVAGGVAQAIVYLSAAKDYSIALWAGSYFVTTAPGALVQLILIPVLYLVLIKAKLIPQRYPKEVLA